METKNSRFFLTLTSRFRILFLPPPAEIIVFWIVQNLKLNFLMKNLIFFIAFLFCLQLSIAQKNGPYQKNYDNGYIAISGQYENGKRIGEWKEYYENGQLSKVYSYTKGKRNNEIKSFFKNGVLKFETKRVDGVFISTHFYERGNMLSEQLLKNGYYKEFYEDGELKIKSNYRDSQLSGVWTSFLIAGEKEWEIEYFNGYKKGFYKQYYKNFIILRIP